MVSTSEVEGLGDSGTPLLYVYMQMFLFIIICCSYYECMYFYRNRHSSLFYYLEIVGGLETFLKNLAIWDIFHVSFLASCSAPCGCNNNSIAVVKWEQPRPTLFAIVLQTRRLHARRCEVKLLLR